MCMCSTLPARGAEWERIVANRFVRSGSGAKQAKRGRPQPPESFGVAGVIFKAISSPSDLTTELASNKMLYRRWCQGHVARAFLPDLKHLVSVSSRITKPGDHRQQEQQGRHNRRAGAKEQTVFAETCLQLLHNH